MAHRRLNLVLTLPLALALGCAHDHAKDQSQTAAAAFPTNIVPRADFNRLAAELKLPLFWVEDKNSDKAVDPDEVAGYWGLPESSTVAWTKDGAFTPAFAEAYAKIVKAAQAPVPAANTREEKRRAAVREELRQGRPTLVQADFTKLGDEDKAIVRHVFEAAIAIERIYAKQKGVSELKNQIAADDTASQMLFFRNQSPWCVAPKTEHDPDCNAIPTFPKPISGMYPADLQAKDPKFCATLQKRPDADALLSPFVVVSQDKDGKLAPVPYSTAFKADMEEVSKALKAAADAIKSPDEQALRAYLLAAAQAFLDNNWLPADEAWAKMNTQNSKWYLRVGPDETYADPCSRKAGFHVSFARINTASLAWQKKLDPLKNDMEKAYADVAGKPYKVKPVSFHLPDFIDIVLNAGDDRAPTGATIGQSLPNWGPVANEGRGRTVAMTNFYKDADSRSDSNKLAQSLFCSETMKDYAENDEALLLDTLLHEASHNLGPSHEYKVNGKTDDQIFGGPTAAMLEELKAETGALFFSDWLLDRQMLDKTLVEQSYRSWATWAFGQISNGMYDAQGKSKPYSQLSAIQLGYLLKEKAVSWNPAAVAANGQDKGCINIDPAKFKAAVPGLAKTVVGIKARGDKKLAAKLIKDYVDSKSAKALHGVITERWLRAPKASFVYSVKL